MFHKIARTDLVVVHASISSFRSDDNTSTTSLISVSQRDCCCLLSDWGKPHSTEDRTHCRIKVSLLVLCVCVLDTSSLSLSLSLSLSTPRTPQPHPSSLLFKGSDLTGSVGQGFTTARLAIPGTVCALPTFTQLSHDRGLCTS